MFACIVKVSSGSTCRAVFLHSKRKLRRNEATCCLTCILLPELREDVSIYYLIFYSVVKILHSWAYHIKSQMSCSFTLRLVCVMAWLQSQSFNIVLCELLIARWCRSFHREPILSLLSAYLCVAVITAPPSLCLFLLVSLVKVLISSCAK